MSDSNAAINAEEGRGNTGCADDVQTMTTWQNHANDAELSVSQLPAPIQRRINALRNNLKKCLNDVEKEFENEVYALELRYTALYEPYLDMARQIINGTHEPTDQEAQWSEDEEDKKEDDKPADQLPKDLESKARISDIGIPRYWRQCLEMTTLADAMIEEHDKPILNHLTDIRVVNWSQPRTGFTLEFHFGENPFFSDSVLTKEYVYENTVGDLAGYRGFEIVSCSGCKIHWKQGKNVTVKLEKKRNKRSGKGGGKGDSKVVTREVKQDSFFNFFSPPKVQKGEPLDVETEMILEQDFSLAELIRSDMVKRSVIFFTGENVEDDYDEDNEEEDENEDEEDEEDDYEDSAPKGHHRKGAKPTHPTNAENCKQQ